MLNERSQAVAGRCGPQLLESGRKRHYVRDEAIKRISSCCLPWPVGASHGQLLDDVPEAIVVADLRQLVVCVISPEGRGSPRGAIDARLRTRFHA